MIPLEECVAVLLCAGLSRRFGPGNKLLEDLNGKPLAAHAAELCAGQPFAARLAVVPPGEPALDALLLASGFELVMNPAPEAGKDSSLRLGLAEALAWGARGIFVLLGDMPHVDAACLRALARAGSDAQAAICWTGETMSPPTLFPAEIARQAIDRPDRPVRESLEQPARVAAAAPMLADYDRPDQFRRRAGPR